MKVIKVNIIELKRKYIEVDSLNTLKNLLGELLELIPEENIEVLGTSITISGNFLFKKHAEGVYVLNSFNKAQIQDDETEEQVRASLWKGIYTLFPEVEKLRGIKEADILTLVKNKLEFEYSLPIRWDIEENTNNWSISFKYPEVAECEELIGVGQQEFADATLGILRRLVWETVQFGKRKIPFLTNWGYYYEPGVFISTETHKGSYCNKILGLRNETEVIFKGTGNSVEIYSTMHNQKRVCAPKGIFPYSPIYISQL